MEPGGFLSTALVLVDLAQRRHFVSETSLRGRDLRRDSPDLPSTCLKSDCEGDLKEAFPVEHCPARERSSYEIITALLDYKRQLVRHGISHS